MTYNFNYRRPLFQSYTILSGDTLTGMMCEVAQKKSVDFIPVLKTKTTVDTAVLAEQGSTLFNVNYIPASLQGSDMKFHTKTVRHWDGTSTRSFFKLTKKQGLKEYEQFLTAVMDDLFWRCLRVDTKINTSCIDVNVCLQPELYDRFFG